VYCFVFLRTELAVGTNDLLENVIGFGSPDEGFRVFIMHSDVFVDGGDQFRNAVKDAARQPVGRNAAEEAFDHVEAGSGGRREVDMETRMLFQPLGTSKDLASPAAW